MNVLVSILKYPPDFTGAGLRTARMYRNLQFKGEVDRIFVITTGACSERRDPCGSSRQEITTVGRYRYEKTPQTLAEILKKSLFVLGAGILTIIQYLRVFKKVDLVHSIDSSWLSTIVGWCCFFTRKPLVKEIVLLGADDPVSIVRNKKHPARFFFLFPFRAARLVVVLSNGLKKSCLSLGIPGSKIWYRLNPVYIDPAEQRWDDGLAAARLVSGKPWILHVGRISRRKNIGFLLRSAAYLETEATLIFVGPWDDAGYHREMMRSAERLHRDSGGMIDAVFLGRITDRKALTYLFAHSKVFWFASRSEGMPNAVLESLICGTPVVSLALDGAMAEVIEPGRNGEIVDNADPALFGAAMQRWLHKGDIDRTDVSRRARQRFDPGLIEQEYLRRFRSVLSGVNTARC